ncbi:S24 family peptidase [Roseovarius ramblicola]|uniref:Helix-turn-helix transcriptional regulator n=1 Tax=Roseovarius ramblicola TaxID=2022336 RepID=A0ABV5HYR0_9RHOB
MTEIADSTGVSYEQLKKLRQRPQGSTNVDDAVKIANFFGVNVSDFIDGMVGLSHHDTVTIAGTVGAGAQVPVFDAYEKGDGPQVACPPGLRPHGVVAVEIAGDSMEPVYSAGDLLFYTRDTHEGVPSEALGRRCVCEDTDGMGWVKLVRAGRDPGTFDLHSFNDAAAPMYGVRLKWAAPVRLHWPADLVRRV